MNKNRLIRFGTTAEATRDSARSTRDTDAFGISATLIQNTQSLGQVEFGLSARKVKSEAAGLAFTAQGVQLSWRPNEITDKLSMAFGFGMERRDYYLTPALPADIKLSASASIVLPKIIYFGYVPEIMLNTTRIKSNYKPRDTFDYGLSLGLRSTF